MKKISPFVAIAFLVSACVALAMPIPSAPTDLNAYKPIAFEEAITFTEAFPGELDGKYVKVECRYDGVMKRTPYSLPYEYMNREWIGPIVLRDYSGRHTTSQAVLPEAKADTLLKLKPGDHVTVYAREELHLVPVETASTIHYDRTPYLIINEIAKLDPH